MLPSSCRRVARCCKGALPLSRGVVRRSVTSQQSRTGRLLARHSLEETHRAFAPVHAVARRCAKRALVCSSANRSVYSTLARVASNGSSFGSASSSPQIYRVVLTGGPCAGKTTAMSLISTRLESFGFKVFRVPEAATQLILGGVDFSTMSQTQLLVAQQALVDTQVALEDAFTTIAASTVPAEDCVVLCDRGVLDSRAYMSGSEWDMLLRAKGWAEDYILQRYDAVVHLASAALGAEEFYTTANNAARKESVAQAKRLERQVRGVWASHPCLRVIENRAGHSFASKVERAAAAVCSVVGVPAPAPTSRYFLLPRESVRSRRRRRLASALHTYEPNVLSPHEGENAEEHMARAKAQAERQMAQDLEDPTSMLRAEVASWTDAAPDLRVVSVVLEYTYLRTDVDLSLRDVADQKHGQSKGSTRLQRRWTFHNTDHPTRHTSVATASLSLRYKADDRPADRLNDVEASESSDVNDTHETDVNATDALTVELHRAVTAREFRSLLHQADPDCETVVKYRHVLVWNDKVWDYDYVQEPARFRGLRILSVELDPDAVDADLHLPPFLVRPTAGTGDLEWTVSAATEQGSIQEVTGLHSYTSRHMARVLS